ncbi:MAG TPA: hypothetical protein VGN57_11840 [Pirellulaceae bacterium]|jgi:cell fate regulator YaaT (PSP1 superfamily)|nr:hypothetical protein [Pirellulaceae bacterium]
MQHGGRNYFIRFGVAGHVGRFVSEIPSGLRRGDRVVARTSRGLELAEVLSAVEADADAGEEFGESIDGAILRPVLETDELLQVRLARYRDRAFDACRKWLEEKNIPGTLVDVEHLLDGESLFFHFLGDPPELDFAASEELAALYEKKVHFRRFADALQQGCGPGCGTESAANGCASGGCSTCATGCGVKKARTGATAS